MKLVFSFLFLSLFAFQVNAQPAQRRTTKEKKEVKSTPKAEAKAEAKAETKPEAKPATPPTAPKKAEVAPPKKKPTTAVAKTPAKTSANGITTRAQLSYPTSMQMKEDVVWRRDIYREIDLTQGDNAGLYYPVEPIGSQMNLFTYLFKLVLSGQIKAYEYRLDGNESFEPDALLKPLALLDNYHIYYERKDGRYMYAFTNDEHKRIYVYADTLEELRKKERVVLMSSWSGVEKLGEDSSGILGEDDVSTLAGLCLCCDLCDHLRVAELCDFCLDAVLGLESFSDLGTS